MLNECKEINYDKNISKKTKYITLLVTSLGILLLNIDLFIVNVGIPTISKSLNAPTSVVAWTISAYALMIGIFPASMGKLSDILGEKKLYLIGVSLFTLASLACAFSTRIEVLILFRILQGFGAATMIPGTLSILIHAYPENQRGLAIGLNSGIGGIGLVAGPLLGGLLVHSGSWNLIFLINVPVGIITIILTAIFVRESNLGDISQKIDWRGLVILSIGLLIILLDLNIEGGYIESIILFAIGVAIIFIFIKLELRTTNPLIDIELFKNVNFALPCISMFLFSASLFGSQPYWSMFFQNYLGFSPLLGGLAFLPATALVALLTPIAGIIGQKSGNKLHYVVLFGAVVTGLGFMYVIGINLDSTYMSKLFPSLVIRGVGIPFLVASTSIMMMNSVSEDKSGLASGVLNMSRNIGTAFGVPILGQVFTLSIGHTMSAVNNVIPNDTMLKTKQLAKQFIVIKDSSVSHAAKTAIVHGFSYIAVCCMLGMIPIFISVIILTKIEKANVSKL